MVGRRARAVEDPGQLRDTGPGRHADPPVVGGQHGGGLRRAPRRVPLGIIADPDDIARWVWQVVRPGGDVRDRRGPGDRRRPDPQRLGLGDRRRGRRAPASGCFRSVLKKLINDPFDAVDEMLEGFVAAHADLVRLAAPRVVARRAPGGPKVGLVIGGGSGHEPAFGGYVGTGLADAAALGNVFAAPGPDVCLDAIRAASSGRGVLLAYGNYAGDVLNFDLAAELAAADGIETRTVRVTDDVASAAPAERDRRRGIAGDVFVFKIAGAAAERGDDLDEVERLAGGPTTRARASGSPCRRARCPAPAGRRSRSGRTRSRSGWASTASRASSAGGSSRPTRWSSGWSRRSSPTGRRAARRGRGRPARQRARCDGLSRPVRRLPGGPPSARGRRLRGQPEPRRRVRDVARDGRRVDHRPPSRRRAAAAPRRSGADRAARLMAGDPPRGDPGACEAIEGAREMLCELDARTGDGITG